MARWLGRGRRRLVPDARSREQSEHVVKPPQAELETTSDGPLDFYTVPDKAEGRPKRGRLPDPDRKQQSDQPPARWYDNDDSERF